MSENTWDSEDYEPPKFQLPPTADRWEGEDEDDIPDDWMASDDDDKDPAAASQTAPVKKKKSLADRIAEKEARRQEELAERRLREAAEEDGLTGEEQIAEKLRRRQLDEEADLELAKEAFGVSEQDSVSAAASPLDTVPCSRAEFDQYRQALLQRLTALQSSAHYVAFVEDLCRDLCSNMDSDDVKKVSTVLNTLYNDKVKSKQNKGKKKKGAKLNVERTIVDDYEDFI